MYRCGITSEGHALYSESRSRRTRAEHFKQHYRLWAAHDVDRVFSMPPIIPPTVVSQATSDADIQAALGHKQTFALHQPVSRYQESDIKCDM